MPPSNSTGGDLVDQLREWWDRQRERFAGSSAGRQQQRPTRPRATRRVLSRAQAVPLGTPRPTTGGRPPRYGGGRRDRAGRRAYTIVLGAVLIIGVIALFYLITYILGSPGSSSSPPASPQPSPSPLPGPAAISSPPPVLSPSPSPSPAPVASPAPPPAQRFHVVEGGDTLNRIAQRYGVTVEQIMQANGFTDRNRILRIGERLVIPDPNSTGPAPVPR